MNWRDIKNPDAGGAELHMHEIGKRWAAAGHEVTLLCAGFQGAEDEEIVSGIKVIRAGNRLSVYPYVLRYLIGRHEKMEHDVILESINTIPFFTPVATRTPVVAQIYSIDNRQVLLRELTMATFPMSMGAYTVSLSVPRVFRKCVITTISESSKTRLIQEGFLERNIHVAFPGVSEAFREMLMQGQELDRPNSTIVYLGRLKRYKGVQDIISAIPILRKTIPNIRLLIIGKGDYEATLRELCASLGVLANVEFCGYVSENQKALLLKSASLFVCTSLDEGGWTISGAEALSAGVPIVVSSSQLDLLGGGLNGALVEGGNPSVLAETISRILLDRASWGMLSKHAIEFSSQFNWDRAAAVTLDALEGVVSS